MNKDEIVQQTREFREEVLKKYNYDLHKYMKNIYKKQKDNPEKYANNRVVIDAVNK